MSIASVFLTFLLYYMIIFLLFCNKPFIISIHGIGTFIGNVTTEYCQFLLKSCYSVEYNYQIYHCIFRIADMNIINVLNPRATKGVVSKSSQISFIAWKIRKDWGGHSRNRDLLHEGVL